VAILLCGFLFVRMKWEKTWSPIWLAGSFLSFWLMIIGGSESGMVGMIVVMVLAIPFVIETREYLGKFLILASSWGLAFTLQRFFYNFLVLETESAGRLGLLALATAVLLAGGLFSAFFWKKKKPEADDNTEKPAKVKWKLGVILMVAVVAVGFAGIEVLGRRAAEAGDTGRNRIYELRELLHGRAEDNFGSSRFYIWRRGIEAFPKNPVIGTGPDTFLHAFPDQEEAIALYGVIFDKAHNEYLQILICQGILGLLFYLAFLAVLFFKAVPGAFGNPMLMAVLAAFTGFCVQAFFNISLPIANQMLWVMAGMLAVFVRLEKNVS
jgi:hypothetical protein